MISTETRSSRVTTGVCVHIKNLNLALKNHKFDGTDPIRVFDFLARFVNEADMVNTSEAQAFIALLQFLTNGGKAFLH